MERSALTECESVHLQAANEAFDLKLSIGFACRIS